MSTDLPRITSRTYEEPRYPWLLRGLGRRGKVSRERQQKRGTHGWLRPDKAKAVVARRLHQPRECHATSRLCQDKKSLLWTERQKSFHPKLSSFPLFKHNRYSLQTMHSLL